VVSRSLEPFKVPDDYWVELAINASFSPVIVALTPVAKVLNYVKE